MKRRILIALCLAACLLLPLAGPSHSEADLAAESAKPAPVVLTVDYGDGAQKRFPRIPWKKKMTVWDATAWAAKHPRGIDVDKQGRGSTTLVTKIDDLRNGQAASKNWIFRVNEKLGDKSCAVFAIESGDRILWSFERYK